MNDELILFEKFPDQNANVILIVFELAKMREVMPA